MLLNAYVREVNVVDLDVDAFGHSALHGGVD